MINLNLPRRYLSDVLERLNHEEMRDEFCLDPLKNTPIFFYIYFFNLYAIAGNCTF